MRTFRALFKSSLGQRIFISIIGTIVNVILAFIMYRFGMVLFLDTIGTIAVSSLGGLLPGILTAVVTNSICAIFNVNAIYYGFLNALVAIMTAWFVNKYQFKRLWRVGVFILVLALFSGSISACLNWNMLDGAQIARNSEAVTLFAASTGFSLFWAYFAYSIFLNVVDKGLAVIIALILWHVIPKNALETLEKGSWRQRPISREGIEVLNNWGKDLKHTMQLRVTLLIIMTSVLLVIVTGWSGIRLYFSKSKEEKTIDAHNCLKLIAELINAEEIFDIKAKGKDAPKYAEVKNLMQTIADNFDSVESLYLTEFSAGEGHIILGINDSRFMPKDGGNNFEYDEKLKESLPKLLNGENVSPIEHGDINSWVRTVFYPLYDDDGNFVCYAVAEVSVTYMADYMEDFAIRSILILSGYFILVLAINMWGTNTMMVYPVRSMAKCVDDFSNLGFEQEQLDKNVRNIRNLDIRTEDEVEKLYTSICKMTLNLSEQMRDLRRLSEATAKMQDGLIITMADMVENRDSDTGEHIRKTAHYVEIIVEGLKKKGYYAEKITPKFISDVVRSAPLHDIGKINISDEILNKPGKLTDEEFEIMKTHTTAGKRIMENAISTVEGGNYLKEARNMAAYHHERWDGKGYPEGLHGEVIPLSARIMAVADVFDALTSPRVYKPAFPLDKALSILNEGSGTQFDPKCIEVFMDALPEVKVVLNKYNKNSIS